MTKPPVDPQREKLETLARDLQELSRRKRFQAMDFWKPYPKQMQFFEMGRTLRERLLSAGNQQGKTEAGAYEAACHLTGRYPEWWPGRRWNRPVKMWVGGEGGLLVRDGPQKKLFGEPGVDELKGTGFVPLADILDVTMTRGVADAYDTVQIQHYNAQGQKDGVSILKFKSYDQGRTKWQSDTIDILWCDEEPPADIYSEGLARFSATGGMCYMTFTPLKGMSNVAMLFLGKNTEPTRGHVTMTIEDAEHIKPEDREAIIKAYPAHERDARSKGIPMLGEGRIFQYAADSITEAPLEYVPLHWTKLWGIDFGIGHPFAAVLSYWDRDNDVIHIAHTIRVSDQLPIMHAAAMKPIGANVPVAWPQDGTARSKSDGKPLHTIYRAQGLLMLGTHATFPDGSNSTEAGILEMSERMATGRLKVAAHLADWFDEFHMYHRKDGLIVKEHDDIMSATRIAVMAKTHGRAVALGGQRFKRRGSNIARGVDFDPF
jgi:phage terminase large subunit-like protein